MTRTIRFFLITTFVFTTAVAIPSFAHAQPGYGSGQRITCSSDNGKRNWCDIGGRRDAQLVRQISGSACIQGETWGVDGRGLWVDRGCRAEFVIGRAPPMPQVITCSSNDGRRNWCDIGGRRDIRLSRQISGSACIQGSTWGVDNRGVWVDRGCRAEFVFGGGGGGGGGYRPPPPPPPQIITCSSNNGKRNWCDTGGSRDIRFNRQISGSACIEGQTWGIDNRGLWVDRGCRAEFRVRY
jgi:hypothetical protein